MKIDASISGRPASAANEAARLEDLGYDGIRVAELQHDPFVTLTLAAAATNSVELLTSVAVAFARNPMSMAQTAHDINALSGGRLVLGLGSQVKPHIERRFGMPWHKPAKQMREFISAMQAIFDCWYDGQRLAFAGEYYTHNLMPATFTPTDVEAGRPRITLSATGPLMTQVAAEVADGMIVHPFSTARYLKEVTLPAVAKGRALRGATADGFDIDYAPMVATGDSEESLAQAIETVRGRIAFYGCTVAYRPVLELHGWGELQDALIPLNRAHRTAEMAQLVDDEVLNTIAVVGEPHDVVRQMRERFADSVTRTSLQIAGLGDQACAELISELRAG